MPMSQPAAPEMLAVIRDYLEATLLPGLRDDQWFNVKVAINMLAIVERELRLAPAADAAERARLRTSPAPRARSTISTVSSPRASATARSAATTPPCSITCGRARRMHSHQQPGVAGALSTRGRIPAAFRGYPMPNC